MLPHEPQPKFYTYNVHKALSLSDTPKQFWLWIYEREIYSITEGYLREKLKFDACIDHTKFLRKLEKTGKSKIESIVPQCLMTIRLAIQPHRTRRNEEVSIENQIITVLDTTIGKENVWISRHSLGAIQIEVWLNDDADVAAFEFYTMSNQELFYW